jgi:translation initiation factor 3 subunit D
LSLEATYVNQNYSFQVVREDATPHDFANPNPFYGPEETEPLASCGYRYRLFDASINDEEDVRIAVRTEVDAYQPGGGKQREESLMTIRTLIEFDSRAQGAGGAPDWRSKLDSQRGAVVATEMKNNSCKLARWAVQSILAGAEIMKIGYGLQISNVLVISTSCSYVSRANNRDNSRHVILNTATVRPSEFAGQLNVSLANGWGIVRTVTDLCMKMPEGKYVLVKDPNRVRVPHQSTHAFDQFLLSLSFGSTRYPSGPLPARRTRKRKTMSSQNIQKRRGLERGYTIQDAFHSLLTVMSPLLFL